MKTAASVLLAALAGVTLVLVLPAVASAVAWLVTAA